MVLMPDEQYYLDHKISISSLNPVMVDVGAHQGVFTEEFLYRYPEAHALVFEPIQSLANRLSKIFQQNDVQVFEFGVGETLKWSNFYEVERASECSSIYYRNNFRGELKPKPIICLDMLYPTFFTFIDYLKIDVEGNEYNVLKGVENMIINRKIRYIQFEYGECYLLAGRKLNEVMQLLLPNYRIFHKDYGYIDDEDFDLSDQVVRNFLAGVKSE